MSHRDSACWLCSTNISLSLASLASLQVRDSNSGCPNQCHTVQLLSSLNFIHAASAHALQACEVALGIPLILHTVTTATYTDLISIKRASDSWKTERRDTPH